MSTVLNTNGDLLEVPKILNRKKFRCAVLTAEWNPKVTHALRDGAVDVLRRAGVADRDIILQDVPGTVELVNGAGFIARSLPDISAIIVIGCVIRGDTPHFDYVCQIAAQGVAELNALGAAPVIFGVLTVDNEQQAIDRAGGVFGNKGAEAAVAAIKMSNLKIQLTAPEIDW